VLFILNLFFQYSIKAYAELPVLQYFELYVDDQKGEDNRISKENQKISQYNTQGHSNECLFMFISHIDKDWII
jgi:hypothetical protein